jgi:hypothetical protein
VLKSLRLYTNDRHWRVDIEVCASDLEIYRSVGTRVVVCHLERVTSIWGGIQSEWEEEPADLIHIHNVYSGAPEGVATREHERRVASRAELREWSVTGEIQLPADSGSTGEGAASLNIHKVVSTVTVKIGDETLMGVLTASSVASEQNVVAPVR